MNNALLYIILLLMVVSAILTIVTNRLFTAVVYSSVLSGFAAFAYVLLGAPDVALAEAVIGSTLATVIFLVTLKKYRIFTIYLMGKRDDALAIHVLQVITKTLQKYDIEPHVLQSSMSAGELLSNPNCDLVVEKKDEVIVLHGEKSSQYLGRISEMLSTDIQIGTVEIEDSLEDSIAEYKGDENS